MSISSKEDGVADLVVTEVLKSAVLVGTIGLQVECISSNSHIPRR